MTIKKQFIYSFQVKKRRICECDDPDCSGFIDEDSEDENANNTEHNGENERKTCSKISSKDCTESSKKKETQEETQLSTIDFFDTSDNTLAALKKKKKKRKETEPVITQEIKLSKKRKNDDTRGNGSTAKKSKDLNNKYEMVFLEEGMNEDDEENLVENTKQSSNKIKIKPDDYISVDCVPKTGLGSLKKRIAHTPGNDVYALIFFSFFCFCFFVSVQLVLFNVEMVV